MLIGYGQDAAPATVEVRSSAGPSELASSMVLRGAVGALIGAACSKPGNEGAWGAAGFFLGATLGDVGIVSIALAAMWKKVA